MRFEIQTALKRGVQVNALDLSHGRYDYDAGRLLDLTQRILATVAAKAERLARSITDPARSGATTLAHVAKVLKATSPNRTAWLLADAEDLAGV